MSSKRMAISALLSNDASTSQPPSPALAPSSDEPPLKRQRQQHQAYDQHYYDSYNAYPYSPNPSASPTSRHYPPPRTQHQSQSPRSGSPRAPPSAVSQTWLPPAAHPQTESRTQWDEGPRYVPTGPVATGGAFDFARPHRQTSNLRGADDEDGGESARGARFQPPGTGKGQSIGGVLIDQMRAPQTHTALPVPPQLRRDAQHSPRSQHFQHPHPSYVAPTAATSPSLAPVRTRDASPLAVKIATPRPTLPSLSPRSSYTSQHVSPTPTASYATQSASPIAHVPQAVSPTMYSRQNVSPAHYVSPRVSPTSTYPPSHPSPYAQYPSTNSPIASQPPHFSRASSSTSYRPTSRSPTAPYTPVPLRPPSRPPSIDHIKSPVSERIRSPSVPVPPPVIQLPDPQPPPVPPPVVQLPEPQPPASTLPQSVPMEVDDDRSFEEELLSLVDGEDVKPKIARSVGPQFPSAEPPGAPVSRKSSGSSSKPAAKPKAPPKHRAPAKSSKAKAAARHASGTGTPAPASSMPPPSPPPTKQQPAVARAKGKATTKKKPAGASAARSRSLSVKPDPTPTPAPDIEMAREDNRLYCVCRTPYDDDKIMIACDRCDEWYHPACVGMPEVEVDLVDQYICVSCGKQKVGLQTTYKQRCHRGLKYIPSHDTLPTCWKPARGAFSKYCSDDCGMAHMRAKILESGRDPASIWPAVKNARRREGVTVTNGPVKTEEPDEDKEVECKKTVLVEARKALKEADERELAELQRRLDEIMNAREACKAALEHVLMRRRLLDLAVDRASGRCCGWDVRLEMNDEEWTAWSATKEGRRALDGKEGVGNEQWWCQGPEKCPRHNGWQNIRDLDVQVEVDSKNSSIKQLTDRERELRRRIEDINPPSAPARQHGRSGGRKKNQGKRSTR